MRAAAWIMCCWPGLAALWRRGSWSGLASAVAFSLLLNSLLGLQFWWPETLPPLVLLGLWSVVAAGWCLGFWHAARDATRVAEARAVASEQDLFIQAQGEYLRGHWFEAEAFLARQLKASPEDLEARLMLASLYRRSRRPREAVRQLDRLQRIEGAGRWQLEIERERRLVRTLEERLQSDSLNGAPPPVKESRPVAPSPSEPGSPPGVSDPAAEEHISAEQLPGEGLPTGEGLPEREGLPEQEGLSERAGKQGHGEALGNAGRSLGAA